MVVGVGEEEFELVAQLREVVGKGRLEANARWEAGGGEGKRACTRSGILRTPAPSADTSRIREPRVRMQSASTPTPPNGQTWGANERPVGEEGTGVVVGTQGEGQKGFRS